MYYCFFEQSGTFKNEFKKLGYEAIDYDIQNEFEETDCVCDLFEEIKRAYNNEDSIFDSITSKDTILAFFPCIRFEDQIQMFFRGTAFQQKNWTNEQKLEYCLKLHNELHQLYEIVTKLVIVCIKRKIPLIIENPYSSTHYLVKYFPIRSKIIDMDRTKKGDYFKKPTQYWFVNCEPKNGLIFEAQHMCKKCIIAQTKKGIERSLISREYANRFIREYILGE